MRDAVGTATAGPCPRWSGDGRAACAWRRPRGPAGHLTPPTRAHQTLVIDVWSAMLPLLPCSRSCCAPPPVVAIVATTFERARWIAYERGWLRSRWQFVTEPRHLGGAVHVVLDELPDGPKGDLIWEQLLLLKHFTVATVEGVIG